MGGGEDRGEHEDWEEDVKLLCSYYILESLFPVQQHVRYTYGVQFPILEKVDVRGPDVHSVWKFFQGSQACFL